MIESISKEIRWFLTKDKIQPIEDWFKSLRKPQKLGDDVFYPRQDYYINMPKVKNLGIKIREPKKDDDTGKLKTALEIKRQISDNEQIELNNNNIAYSNKWQKFSYELIEGEEGILSINFPLPSEDKNWLRVDKDRITVRYDAESKSIYEGNDYLNEACGIELTKVKILKSVYYSFGLEAFSKSGYKLDDNFSECCDFVFSVIGLKGLTIEESLSYPEFLSKFI